ncbi:MAG: response regulator receiver modulated diguanylate cyclase [Halomonadaceae bacterium T82-2]|nr:MAG: response regulator receiver modulated diguanylate cyclase [Halomonadaceae bacterium T82-2]
MTPMANADIRARLERMRHDYGLWLGRECADLSAQAQELGNPILNGAPWEPVRERLHRIAGSAGTFGFQEASEICRLLEHRLERILQTGASGDAGVFLRELDSLPALVKSLTPERLSIADDLLHSPVVARSPEVRESRQPLIFVLDDDATTGQPLCRMLESFHYRTCRFSTGDALERACREQRPDALILDLHLEVEDGLAIGEAVQHLFDEPLPLFVTSRAQAFEDQLRAVRAGVVGIISHPLDPIRLADMLETHLRRHRLPPARVLLVDDDEMMHTYHRLLLEEVGFTVMTLSRPEGILEAMEGFAPDVLVLDVHMPQCSGPELAQIVRYHPRWLQVPIIYLSAALDAGAQLEAMTKAGDDFLTKPIAPEALVAAVTARARRSRELAAALSRDGLTGLLKHADIKERLQTALAQARRRNTALCVAMLDIDHFKSVNDTHGHLAGDEVIRALANLLRRRLRESDLIGRYGGEEFLLVLNDCDRTQALQVLDELRESFKALAFHGDDRDFQCTLSAGLVALTPDFTTGDALINAADQHLYQAKQAGRDCVIGGAGPVAADVPG